jgi:type II secretory pathway pseudopilin PulG
MRPGSVPGGAGRARARGFAYLWLLFYIVFMGVGLAGAGVVWEQRQRREKEADLLFIGGEMRRAIRNYYLASPEAAKLPPLRLEDLVEDRRGLVTRRHLRRIYLDPLTGKADWGLVREQGRITGVYSMARGVPLRQGAFREEDSEFAGAQRYADWRFVAGGIAVAATAPAAPRTGMTGTPGPGRPPMIGSVAATASATTSPAPPAAPPAPAPAPDAVPDPAPVPAPTDAVPADPSPSAPAGAN